MEWIQINYYCPQTKFAKIMFLHLTDSHFINGGGDGSASRGLHGVCISAVCINGGLHPAGVYIQGAWVDPPDIGYYRIRSTSGWYLSYWNAFFSSISYFNKYEQINIKPDTPINVYTRFCLNTAKSKFSLVSPVADW